MSIRKGRRLKKYLGLKWERINPLSSKEIIKVPKEPQKYLKNVLGPPPKSSKNVGKMSRGRVRRRRNVWKM